MHFLHQIFYRATRSFSSFPAVVRAAEDLISSTGAARPIVRLHQVRDVVKITSLRTGLLCSTIASCPSSRASSAAESTTRLTMDNGTRLSAMTSAWISLHSAMSAGPWYVTSCLQGASRSSFSAEHESAVYSLSATTKLSISEINSLPTTSA